MIRTFLLASLMAVGLCLPGGYNEVTDPAQLHHAKDLLNGLQTNGMLTLDSSCTIQKIEKQIVAGENIRYTMSCSGHTCHLVVFNQVWTSTLKVTENQCVHKRQVLMAGGYYTQTNPDDIQNYIDKLAGLVSAGRLTLEQYTVVKVETQVVAGVNIRYTIQIGDNTCTIILWEQSWTNMQQITTNTCSKTRRQLGGYNEVTDPTQVQTAKDLLNGLQTNGMLTLDSSCTIQKIEKQIVAGENIKYTMSCSGHTCHLVVFNQVWTSTLKVTENQCVHKRQLGMVGGYYTQTDAAEIQKYTDKLAGLVSAGSLTLEQYTVVKVETQVVAGVNIRYTLQMGDNTCTIVVWEQSWTNMQQITSNTCSKARRQLGGGVLLGGWSNIDKDVPEVGQCISKALDSINGMSNSLFRMVDSHVISAKQQVVAGMNYAVTFQTQQSTCMNNQAMFGKTSADCPVDANSMMAQSTWKAQCYKHLDGTFDLSDVSLV